MYPKYNLYNDLSIAIASSAGTNLTLVVVYIQAKHFASASD